MLTCRDCAIVHPMSFWQVVVACLSYDFSGSPDEKTEESHPIAIPTSWTILKNEGAVNLIFDLLDQILHVRQFDSERSASAAALEALTQVRLGFPRCDHLPAHVRWLGVHHRS